MQGVWILKSRTRQAGIRVHQGERLFLPVSSNAQMLATVGPSVTYMDQDPPRKGHSKEELVHLLKLTLPENQSFQKVGCVAYATGWVQPIHQKRGLSEGVRVSSISSILLYALYITVWTK